MFDPKLHQNIAQSRQQPLRVGIIGGGMSGICMACKLLEAIPGIQLTIFELNDQLGGTWYTHTYPGVACDSPSHLYSFWFCPNPQFQSKFAKGSENLSYLQSVAAKHDLDRFVRYRTDVISAQWDPAKSVWHSRVRDLTQHETSEPEEMDFDVLISCAGGQRHPVKPSSIIDHFDGSVFHSSEWPSNLDLAGKKVAVVGTGSSSVQIVPALANMPESQAPSEIHVFQRSPGWVLKLPRGEFSSTMRAAFEMLPWLLWLYRAVLLVYYDVFIHWLLRKEGLMRTYALSSLSAHFPVQKDSQASTHDLDEKNWNEQSSFSSQKTCSVHTAADKTSLSEMGKALTPGWNVGCRRVMVSDTFYPSLLKENVHFHPSQVKCVSSKNKRNLLTGDDESVEVDMVILATGYSYHEWIRPLQITNHVNEELVNVWQTSNVRGRYFGLATSDFPNFFHLFGPASRPGQGALSTVAELQAAEIIKCITELAKLPSSSAMSVSFEAESAMADTIHAGIVDSPFAEKCGGWYKNANGYPSTLWPFSAFRFHRLLHSFDRNKTWIVSTAPLPKS